MTLPRASDGGYPITAGGLLNFDHSNGSPLVNAATAITGPGVLRWIYIAWVNYTTSGKILGLTDVATGKKIFDMAFFGSGAIFLPVNVKIASTATWAVAGTPGAAEATKLTFLFEDTSPDANPDDSAAMAKYR